MMTLIRMRMMVMMTLIKMRMMVMIPEIIRMYITFLFIHLLAVTS